MKKQKSTKRALLLSALSLLMCVSMLIGSTFAWFTDSVTVSGNKIQAGTLDVALEMSTDNGTTWTNAEGKTLAWVDSDGNTLWEPGCTYTLPMLRVRNNGDLKLKYTIAITGINGDAKLNEAIEWTGLPSADTATLNPLTASKSFTIKGHMKEDAGNEYQGLSIEGISITVYATQAKGEYDSFTNKYDKNAPLPGAIIDSTFYATLQEAINAAAATEGGATVKLGADVDLTEAITIPAGETVGLDLNGHSISQTQAQTAAYSMIVNRGTLIIADSIGSGVISYTDTSDGTHYNVSNTIQNLGMLTINGGTIKNMSDVTNAANGWPQVIDTNSGSANTSVTINGGALYCANYSAIRMFCTSKTYTNTVEINDGEIYGRVDFQNPSSGKNLGKLTINGGTFDSNDSHAWSMFVFGASNTTDGTGMELSVTGGTFLKPIEANYAGWSIGAGFDYGFITGGTFVADPSDYVAEGYSAVKNADGTWTVVEGVAVSTADELEHALFWLDDGSVALVSGTINVTEPANQGNYGVMATMGVNLVSANGGTIKDTTNSDSGIFVSGNVTLIEGLTVESNSNKAFHIQGNKKNLTLRDVTINNADDCAVYLQGATDIILENVTATAGGIADNAGSAQGVIFATKNLDPNQTASTVTIKSGTYTANEDGAAVVWSFYNSVVTIEGGTFTGLLKTADGGQIVIKGGTFSVDPSAYLADGYVATENNGTWTVSAE